MKFEIVKQSLLSLIPLAYINFQDVMTTLQSVAGLGVLGIQGGYLLWKWNRESKRKQNSDNNDDISSSV